MDGNCTYGKESFLSKRVTALEKELETTRPIVEAARRLIAEESLADCAPHMEALVDAVEKHDSGTS